MKSYAVVAPPGKDEGLADGNAFEAVDDKFDGLDIER